METNMKQATYTGPSDFKEDLSKLYPGEHFKYAHDVFPHPWKNKNDLAFTADEEPPFSGYLRQIKFNTGSLAITQLYITDQPLSGSTKSLKLNLDSLDELIESRISDVDYIQKSLNRTKKIFRRLIMHNYTNETRLVTLTYANACHDRDEHFHYLRELVIRFRQYYNEDMNYIAVPEFHPGGHGYHWHLVVNNTWFDYEHFYRMLWKQGLIFVSEKPSAPAFANAGNLADYLVKYISKDMTHAAVAKRRYTRGGFWSTDWAVSTGFTPESFRTFKKVLAYLASLDVPCQSGRFEPYEGQVIFSIVFDSGRYPDLRLSKCFQPKARAPVCTVHRKGDKLITPEQGDFFNDIRI